MRRDDNRNLTSTEIAKLAGVSRSTISRVINGYSNVPQKTRDHVMAVIRQYNYYPHLSGQLLVGKKVGTLGFFWIKGGDGSIAQDDLSSSYLVHVIEAAARLGYLTLTCILENLDDLTNIDWVKKTYMQGRIDAGIFIGVNNDEPVIEELIAGGQIVGIFDHYHPDDISPNRISVNYEKDTGCKIIKYLHDLGHKKIALLYGDDNRYSSVTRKQGFLHGMAECGITVNPEWMCLGGIDDQQGYIAAKNMITKAIAAKELPTAICANNDAVAFGAYKALKEMGIKIPDQISVIGIDGHSRMVRPSLTTYAFDYYEVFSSLVARTIAAVEDIEDNPTTEFINGRLLERDSIKDIRGEG